MTKRGVLASLGTVVVASLLLACNTDASITKDAVGVWTWNPRASLSREKVVDAGFPTPSMEALQLDADGHCVFVEKVPGYDTDVAGKPFHVPEYWIEYRGTWSVDKGKLDLDMKREWGAAHRSSTPPEWALETVEGAPQWGRTFKVEAHDRHRLRLETLAIGDYDRDFQKTTALPQRPTVL